MKITNNLSSKIEACRSFCTEVSKNAGIAKGIKFLVDHSSDSESRYYFKNLLEAQFKQLIISLDILTLDKFSDIRIEKILSDFESSYGARYVELGLAEDIEREGKYIKELEVSIQKWNKIRKNYAAHFNINYENDFEVDLDKISLFLEVSINILNTIIRTVAVPSDYPKIIKSVSYSTKRAVNLEQESYNAIVKNLKWTI